MQTIAVVDYGMGNLRSVSKAIEHVAPGARVHVTHDAKIIAAADHVVFPGQGAARDCMAAIRANELAPVIADCIANKPFLGICMGLQVLMDWSEENGGTDLLSMYSGEVSKFKLGAMSSNGFPFKVPHMGWSQVDQRISHPLWNGIADHSRFYFVHSYFVKPESNELVAATTSYGEEFCCAIAKDNVFAVQFHPEKSARDGLRLLKNFVEWRG